MKIRLPDRSRVVLTGETDPIQRHYQPVVRYFMNKRLAMAMESIGQRRFHRLLDAGYGGGVFLPELTRRTEELYGVDIHSHHEAVSRMAAAEGLTVHLRQASLAQTGFPDRYFDGVVCISVLEFVEDLQGAMAELHRILAPQGRMILGIPGHNFLTKMGYRLARTPDPRRVHRQDYRTILQEAKRHLRLITLRRFPVGLPHWAALFFCAHFERR